AYAVNLRGHYGSKTVPDFGRISFYDHLTDLREVIRKLDNPVLFGHSMGGLLVQKLAESETVPAAVLIAPAPPKGIWVVSSVDHLVRAFAHGKEIINEQALRPDPEEAFRTTLNRLPPEQQLAVYEKGWSQSGKLLSELILHGVPVDPEKVKTKMRVIVGTEDRQTPPRVARRVAERYGADYQEYNGFAHVLIIEPGWDWIAKETAEWLDKRL
ncbi:MAG TPA: alpha/beta fold hydrolase, partial [Nitrospiria bacterium]|nr:alpha/beta fold hydrolase [Nitrospiria bacterium]